MDAIIEKHFPKANLLLEALNVGRPPWDEMRHLWVFRGHAIDTWELIPKSLRDIPRPQLGYTSSPKLGKQKTNLEQIQAEFEAIHEFMRIADAQGLSIPVSTSLLRTPLSWETFEQKFISNGWPIDDLLAVTALAQHYGVATRFLDWTDKPLVAAYFAAKDAVNEAAKNTSQAASNLAVWGLNLDWTMDPGWTGAAARTKGIPVYIVTAPRASNPNLHAQGGVFTTQMLSAKMIKPGVKLSVDGVDQHVKNRWPSCAPHSVPAMCHYTLPSSEAGHLLRLLYQDGISAATVYPGYQGAADSLKERSLWDIQERSTFWIPR